MLKGTTYEVSVFDQRDMDKSEPASTLGTFNTVDDALNAVVEYRKQFPEMPIYKIEISVDPKTKKIEQLKASIRRLEQDLLAQGIDPQDLVSK